MTRSWVCFGWIERYTLPYIIRVIMVSFRGLWRLTVTRWIASRLVKEPSFPGCLIEVRPIGVLIMIDPDQIDQPL
jgi:hypothetical protein